jgi:hypothetical protein
MELPSLNYKWYPRQQLHERSPIESATVSPIRSRDRIGDTVADSIGDFSGDIKNTVSCVK